MHSFLCQNVRIIPNYVLLKRKINTFCLKVSLVYIVLAHFEPKKSVKIYRDFLTLSSLHVQFFVPNCSNIHKTNLHILV